MDHLDPGYRAARLRRKPHTARTLIWATLGACTALGVVWAATTAPDAVVLFGFLAGLMAGATRP